MRPLDQVARRWGLAGLVVASVLLAVLLRLPDRSATAVSGLGLFVWPSEFWLMALEFASPRDRITVYVMAVAANYVVYAIAGVILTSAYRRFLAPPEVPPDD